MTFISEEELKRDHSAMPHGGFVIRSGKTGDGNAQVMEYSLKLDSNPEFTSSVLVTYTRAAYRLHQNGDVGAKTVFDIAPGLLSPKSAAALRKELLQVWLKKELHIILAALLLSYEVTLF